VSGPLVYVDMSEVREGVLDRLREAIDELARFIEANVPGVLAYNFYLSEDGREMTVVHIHADPTSLDQHLEVGGPVFAKFADLITLEAIHVYGTPSEAALEKMREKARTLGSGEVVVHPPEAGFNRLRPVAKLD
jgi:Antibiotic biosynthesis monooxygenase